MYYKLEAFILNHQAAEMLPDNFRHLHRFRLNDQLALAPVTRQLYQEVVATFGKAADDPYEDVVCFIGLHPAGGARWGLLGRGRSWAAPAGVEARAAVGVVEQLDGVDDAEPHAGEARAGGELHVAARVARGEKFGAGLAHVPELLREHARRQLRLQKV